MKKRIFALTGILLALLLVLAGCGSSNMTSNSSKDMAYGGSYNGKNESFSTGGLYDTESPMMPSPEPGERDDDAALTTDRKLIQTAWMELESRDYAQALAALEQMVTGTSRAGASREAAYTAAAITPGTPASPRGYRPTSWKRRWAWRVSCAMW